MREWMRAAVLPPSPAAVVAPTAVPALDLRVRLALFVVGCVVVAITTQQFGPGGTADSVTYLSVGENLAEGRGFVRFDGRAFAAWPPLYPILLAVVTRLGLEVNDAARVVGGLCFGLTLAAFGEMMHRVGRSAWLTLILLAVPPVVQVFSSALSEAPMTMAMVLGVAALGRGAGPLELGLYAALALSSRHVGLSLLIVLGASIFQKKKSGLLIFLPVAVAPSLAWSYYNLQRVGEPTGVRAAANASLYDNFDSFFTAIGKGFGVYDVPGALLGWLFMGLLLFGWRGWLERRAAALTVIYTLLVVGTASVVAVTHLNFRFVEPVLPFLVFLGLAAVPVPWKPALALSVVLGIREVAWEHNHGIAGFGGPSWGRSPLLSTMAELPVSDLVFTNDPHAMALFTEHEVAYMPMKRSYRSEKELAPLGEQFEKRRKGQACYIAWFTAKRPGYSYYSPDRLKELGYPLEIVSAPLKGGLLYRIEAGDWPGP